MDLGEARLDQFDEWLTDDSEVAAVVLRQWLVPAEGKDAVIFPPTYAKPDGVSERDWLGYNTDRLEDGTKICQIDSVGSQANRMEPIFKRAPYRHLVPQVAIMAGGRKVELLDAGHRAADAIARFSTLGPELFEAFSAYQRRGDAERLAHIAPTSIVFGAWDSRATQAKLPRIVRSVVRAYDVVEFHRSAQYTTIAGEILEDGETEVTTKGPEAELGLAHVPAVLKHGGVQVRGEIRRESSLNLTALRALGSASGEPADDTRLRRYILGLALVVFTAPQDACLREGCVLVPDETRKPEWRAVKQDGTRADLVIEHKAALRYATAAAQVFGVRQPAKPAEFDAEIVKRVMALSEDQRKLLLKRGPVTRESLDRFQRKGPGKSAGKRERTNS